MKAKIISAKKDMLPRYNAATNQDEPTLVVIIGVEFYKDDGTLHHTQTYAMLPEEVPADVAAYYQKQADAMQQDLDGQVVNAANQKKSEMADSIVEKINQTI